MPALYTFPLYELWYKEGFLYRHVVTFLSHCVSVHRNLLYSVPLQSALLLFLCLLFCESPLAWSPHQPFICYSHIFLSSAKNSVPT